MKTDALSKHLSWVAAGLNVLAYVTYLPFASPNITAWGLWSFIVLLNVSTYRKMTGDPVMSLLAKTSAALTVLTFLCSVIIGQFGKVGYWDMAIFAIGLIACLVWWMKQSATYAQLMVQACVAIGFVPNIMSVWAHPASEPSYAWFLWTAGFAVQGIVVKLRWKNQWQDAVYPINCTFWHLTVAILALRA